MATTSSNLVAGKAISGQSGNGNNERSGLKAKLAAGVAILGCAAAVAFGGAKLTDHPTPSAQSAAAPANVAHAQTRPGNGYLEFAPGDVSSSASTAIAVSNIAQTRSLAGPGFLEFQPGEAPVVGARTNIAATGIGLREYLDGEIPAATLPLSSPTTQPAPLFGPQP
jgi:hypothetical protein